MEGYPQSTGFWRSDHCDGGGVQAVRVKSTCSSLAVLRQRLSPVQENHGSRRSKSISAMRSGTRVNPEPNDASRIDGQPFGQGSGYIRSAPTTSDRLARAHRCSRVYTKGCGRPSSPRLDYPSPMVELTEHAASKDPYFSMTNATPAAERSIKPGTYRLKVEAKGYLP